MRLPFSPGLYLVTAALIMSLAVPAARGMGGEPQHAARLVVGSLARHTAFVPSAGMPVPINCTTDATTMIQSSSTATMFHCTVTITQDSAQTPDMMNGNTVMVNLISFPGRLTGVTVNVPNPDGTMNNTSKSNFPVPLPFKQNITSGKVTSTDQTATFTVNVPANFTGRINIIAYNGSQNFNNSAECSVDYGPGSDGQVAMVVRIPGFDFPPLVKEGQKLHVALINPDNSRGTLWVTVQPIANSHLQISFQGGSKKIEDGTEYILKSGQPRKLDVNINNSTGSFLLIQKWTPTGGKTVTTNTVVNIK